MIGFVIPLRSKKMSKNWNLDVQLLRRTLLSILAQTNEEIQVALVYTDFPDLHISDSRLNYIQYPFDFLNSKEITDLETFARVYYPSDDFIEKVMDQASKITYGCIELKKLGCDYIMAVDADDLISNRIAEFVKSHSTKNQPGWYIQKGYLYLEGSNWILLQRDNMYNINGSTYIIRTDLVKIPTVRSTSLFDNNFFTAHGYLKQRIVDEHNLQLAPLPFYGTIYTANGNNWSTITETLQKSTFKMLIKKFLLKRPLSKKIIKEFGVYKIA